MIPLLAGILVMAWAQPEPALNPAQVVRIVVDALRSNNAPLPNAGIFTTYRFSSPANRAITGPYGNFLRIVKHPDFAPLLRESNQSVGSIHSDGNRARQVVQTRGSNGQSVDYEFVLTRQASGPCTNCWMVDGVSRLDAGR